MYFINAEWICQNDVYFPDGGKDVMKEPVETAAECRQLCENDAKCISYEHHISYLCILSDRGASLSQLSSYQDSQYCRKGNKTKWIFFSSHFFCLMYFSYRLLFVFYHCTFNFISLYLSVSFLYVKFLVVCHS